MTRFPGLRWVAGLAGLCLASTAWAEAPGQRWTQGTLSVRLLEAGYSREAKSGAWEAEVVLRFVNLSQERRFNQAVQVQFVDEKGKLQSSWKTFLSLPPGQAQHRRVRAPGRLACPGDLAACPALRLGLRLKGAKPLGSFAEIPRSPLKEEGAPPEGQTLYVARVFDGESFQVLEGQKLRLLGMDAPERKAAGKPGPEPYYREARDYLYQRIMDGPVTLSFDGERRDASGRWLALVRAEDGGLVNLEMLQKGLAKVYPGTDFSLRADFEKAEQEAKRSGLGLWAGSHP
jgi:endonuclease YncB( thermonuclease family)